MPEIEELAFRVTSVLDFHNKFTTSFILNHPVYVHVCVSVCKGESRKLIWKQKTVVCSSTQGHFRKAIDNTFRRFQTNGGRPELEILQFFLASRRRSAKNKESMTVCRQRAMRKYFCQLCLPSWNEMAATENFNADNF